MKLTQEQGKLVIANRIFGRRLLNGVDGPPAIETRQGCICGCRWPTKRHDCTAYSLSKKWSGGTNDRT